MLTDRIRNVPRWALVLARVAVVVGVLSLAPWSSTSSSGVPAAPSGGQWWRPVVGADWQWQLSGSVDTSVSAAVFDVDGEGTSAATVAELHRNGARVICYFGAGGWESYRSDAASFPAHVLGNAVDGWPDERWLDIRELAVLLPIMEARIADCRQKGFDAVEPDLVDGYTNDSGFALTGADQLAYNRALADLAHRYGLGVALKNDPEQVEALEPAFDFAVVEECYQYGECEAYSPFVRAGKAVLHVEYEGSLESFCPTTTGLGFSSIKKQLSLDAWRQVCRPDGTSAIEAYVTQVYQDLFHRTPDPAGLATWTEKLASGTPYGAVANAITSSPEYRSGMIRATYQRYLGRTAEAAGLQHWLGRMNAGLQIEQMQAGFIASDEFYARGGGSPDGWVTLLYQTVLERNPAPSEVAWWVDAINHGMNRGTVALGFLYSTEHLTTVVDGYYANLLGRHIDPSGKATWVGQIQHGHRDEEIIAGIVASNEYRANV